MQENVTNEEVAIEEPKTRQVSGEELAEVTKQYVSGVMEIAQSKIEEFLLANGYEGHKVILQLDVYKEEDVVEEVNGKS